MSSFFPRQITLGIGGITTPQYVAAQEGHGEVVAALVKGGCDVGKEARQ